VVVVLWRQSAYNVCVWTIGNLRLLAFLHKKKKIKVKKNTQKKIMHWAVVGGESAGRELASCLWGETRVGQLDSASPTLKPFPLGC
jgi:hypothetical protein